MHQSIIDDWAALLKTIAAAREGSNHPDAHAFLDAIEKHAQEQTELMAQKKAEADTKK